MAVSESELEVKAIEVLRSFIGKNPEQIESILKEHLNPLSKSYFRMLADRMLRSSPDINLELFEKAVSIRAVRLQKNLMPKESMSLPAFKFESIVEQEWVSSDLRRQLKTRFLFLVFETQEENNSGMIFTNASFWSMPDEDIEKISFVWEDTKRKIQDERYDAFIPKKANLLAHVRPHAQSASDVQIYKGKEYRKYSFWLNNDYIGSILARLPRLLEKIEVTEGPIDLEGAIIQQLSGRDTPMLPFKLKMSLDPELLESESYDIVVNSMIQRGLIDRTTDGIRLKKNKLKEMLKEAPEIVSEFFSMDKDVFREKYTDGEKTILTIQSFFTVKPEEDELGKDFSKYKLSSKLFQDLYGIDEMTYRYLELMHPKGWMSPEELLDDPSKTDTFKRKLRANLYNTVELPDAKVEVCNESIITYVVSKYTKPKGISEISRLCKDFIMKNGLKSAPLCKMNGGDIKDYADLEGTKLLRVDSSHVKYYPHDEKEVIQFLKDLELDRYMNMYVAAQLIINNSGNLCKSMDLYDEQELFMLMSKYKLSAPMKNAKAMLSSPPSICFGEATISNQIEGLLQETGRIEKTEFIRIYSERYGMKEQSIRAYMTKYPQYSNGSYYDMNLPEFPDYIIDYLKSQFTAPIISTEVATNRFRKAELNFKLEIIDKDAKKHNDPYFNAENLRKLGYKGAQGSIFKDKYQNLRECVESEYLNRDFITLDNELKDNVSFMRIFDEYLSTGSYYLIGEDQYISYSKLESANVTKAMMADYVEQVSQRVDEKDYFTLEFLRNTGFEHPLEDKGFEDDFYENILSNSHRLRNSDIGRHKVYTKSERFNRNDAVVNITLKTLDNDDSDYADLLSDRIRDLYGLNLLSELKKEHKPLKYCKYTEKIYRDDDTYINEIRRIQ